MRVGRRFLPFLRLNRDDAAYILDTFPIVRRTGEDQYNGDHRARRLIVEIYDAIAESIRAGKALCHAIQSSPGNNRNA